MEISSVKYLGSVTIPYCSVVVSSFISPGCCFFLLQDYIGDSTQSGILNSECDNVTMLGTQSDFAAW